MRVALGLGSNQGDRLAQLQRARAFLVGLSHEQWHRCAPLYETEPVGCPAGSEPFFNTVVEIEFAGAARTLLRKIKAYEQARGRDLNAPRNAPRPIDIDILFFGDLEICEKDLIVPHPRLAERRFVLVPLATLEPHRIIKGTGRTVQQLLRELPAGGPFVRFVQQEW
ncbi:MAG: 2-amino-4-hydroxy-6-hydroxymethyldihydropteridine diphosphokinase [Verrucomicrobiae bacterium]|nr:2-amino-4-hydroxy-6-hydroxymethyldihydropteridine diphosphokinase [Verrucomicrobiae bacterium]